MISITLKGGASSGSVTASNGQYSKGDGHQSLGSANLGIPLNGDAAGYAWRCRTATATTPTARVIPRCFRANAMAIRMCRTKDVLLNVQYTIAPGVYFYAFGGYSKRDSAPNELFRNYASTSRAAGGAGTALPIRAMAVRTPPALVLRTIRRATAFCGDRHNTA
ncbi:hypothetical protein [Rhodanobacter sp. B04]|uniref:hypothetical protein n=1 Tax=Rhodanobacter sp. B04 TaxID=1945860 RepID=UPI001115670E|nr:hypothetical protein [Rhodanobacter sp. B04]